jgi:hypothetical protein
MTMRQALVKEISATNFALEVDDDKVVATGCKSIKYMLS